jgi:hypothetical protein
MENREREILRGPRTQTGEVQKRDKGPFLSSTRASAGQAQWTVTSGHPYFEKNDR